MFNKHSKLLKSKLQNILISTIQILNYFIKKLCNIYFIIDNELYIISLILAQYAFSDN